MNEATAIDLTDEAFLRELREQMLKFARLQLNDEQLAEDAVQEALIGALKNARSFARQAALKTWVFAILKNKIADILRGKYRRNEVSDYPTYYTHRHQRLHYDDICPARYRQSCF